MRISSLRATPSTAPLRELKQQLVRDTIREAALDLFVNKGFEATTVDDIAKAAGVSRRSLFRYFSSKNDVLGQTTAAYGRALSEAILAAPHTYSPMELMRAAVLRIAALAAAHPRTGDLLKVVTASPAARQAQLAGQSQVEDQVAGAFASRLQKTSAADATAKLLASLTLSIIDVTFKVWFATKGADLSAIAEQMIETVTHLAREEAARSRSSHKVVRHSRTKRGTH